jgi:hypothetical protein
MICLKQKKAPAERLLSRRESAGDCSQKHARYHDLVSRYQKLLLRRYLRHRRDPLN